MLFFVRRSIYFVFFNQLDKESISCLYVDTPSWSATYRVDCTASNLNQRIGYKFWIGGGNTTEAGARSLDQLMRYRQMKLAHLQWRWLRNVAHKLILGKL